MGGTGGGCGAMQGTGRGNKYNGISGGAYGGGRGGTAGDASIANGDPTGTQCNVGGSVIISADQITKLRKD